MALHFFRNVLFFFCEKTTVPAGMEDSELPKASSFYLNKVVFRLHNPPERAVESLRGVFSKSSRALFKLYLEERVDADKLDR